MKEDQKMSKGKWLDIEYDLDNRFNVRINNIHKEIINNFQKTHNMRDQSRALRALLIDYERIRNNGHSSQDDNGDRYVFCEMELPPKLVPKDNCEQCRKRTPKVWLNCSKPIFIRQ